MNCKKGRNKARVYGKKKSVKVTRKFASRLKERGKDWKEDVTKTRDFEKGEKDEGKKKEETDLERKIGVLEDRKNNKSL